MNYLIAISIGPVQDFIAASRRTSDLWAGSQLLVDLAKEIAQELQNENAQLIFPANVESNGPNKILAEYETEDGQTIQSLIDRAKVRAQKVLLDRFESAKGKLTQEQRGILVFKRSQRQIESFLEIYAAWMPLPKDKYKETRKNLDLLLAGRKALRDFEPATGDDAGLPKSSLDPSRASVFLRDKIGVCQQKPLRMKKTEFLDAISLLKRIEGSMREGNIPDTTSMAQRSVEPGFLLSKDIKGESEREEYSPKFSYYAIIVADGDKMGDRISKEDDPDKHREFSQKLAGFAADVKGIVEKNHDGFLVYAGGDDVLALVPVINAIACAQEISSKFNIEVGANLSAGVAIVHHKEPLQRALEAARSAEKVAKVKRNSLAVALHTRGGSPVVISEKWDANSEAWEHWKELYKSKVLSHGIPYDLTQLAWEWNNEIDSELLKGEAQRIWKRKIDKSKAPANLSVDFPEDAAKDTKALRQFADKLKIARFLGAIKEGNNS